MSENSNENPAEKAEETPLVDVEAETEEEKKKREEAEQKAKEEAERKEKLKIVEIQDGDMVMVDILGKTVEEDGEGVIFQASNPDDAKLLLNYEEDKKDQYMNELAIIGKKGFLQDKIDETIKGGMKFFEEKTIELSPDDAFGKREGNKIEKVSAKKFMKDMEGEKPYRGATYRDKKGRTGTVIRAAQGRCLVDFNHPLAGKTVSYRIIVTDKIEGFDQRAKALLARRLGGRTEFAEEFKIDLDEDTHTLEIEIPQMMMFQLAQQQGGIYFKMGSAMDMQENLDGVETVKFVEVFEKTPAPTHTHDHEHEHEHEHEGNEEIQDATVVEEAQKE